MQVTEFDNKICRIDVSAFRVPVASPVVTSFGAMTSRPAVFVRLEDSDGAFGWGEIFANWPAAGAEHRARLVVEDIADLVLDKVFCRPTSLFEQLSLNTHIRALQCGEWGPFAQAIAGLDIAFNDLQARRAGLSLARYLHPDAKRSVPTYCSGIHIREASRLIPLNRAMGFDAFKVKVGFDRDADIRLVHQVIDALSPAEQLFADANQAWTVSDAIDFLSTMNDQSLGWIEEPLPADALLDDWRRVKAASAVPLAGGENITGTVDFDAAISSGIMDVIQPDVAKWGGISQCREVANKAIRAGRRYCPHFLGGGIGLAASAAVLASVAGDGLLEVDSNRNPLREAFNLWPDNETRNRFLVSDDPGLGIVDLPEEINQYLSFAASASKVQGAVRVVVA